MRTIITLITILLSSLAYAQTPIVRVITPPSHPMPKAPAVKTPKKKSAHIKVDISRYRHQDLAYYADKFYKQEDYARAAKYQYWAIKNGNDGYYNMACYTALSGDINAARYWLIKESKEVSADLQLAVEDPDLKPLRDSVHWPDLRTYIAAMANYWKSSVQKSYSLVIPKKHKKEETIPLFLGLHGKGDNPISFVDGDYQLFADKYHIAIAAISGPIVIGKKSYAWSKNQAVNEMHVANFIADITRKEGLRFSSKALFGFSQGAFVSMQVAGNRPHQWRGALVMSPGLYPVTTLALTAGQNKLVGQQYIITSGGKERDYNASLAKNCAGTLENLGAQIDFIPYPELGHRFPNDYYDKLPEWITRLLSSATAAK